MHKILVIGHYFLLDALHVSDYISPSSGATLYGYRHTTARRIGIYHMRRTAYKVAPDGGLI